MKIAVLSDTRLPTSPNYSGHGLGQIVHTVAKGLAERGHHVTLFAAPRSEFAFGSLVTANDEKTFLRHDLTAFEAIIDNTHQHVTGAIAGLPTIQVSHDREHTPLVNAVFPTRFHRDWHGKNENNARVIHNGVNIPAPLPKRAKTPYTAYLSTFYAPKQPLMAMEAARLAGVKLHMAGTTPPAPPPGASYLGPLAGVDKLQFLSDATCLLFPASTEAGSVTVLEAQAVGCPVIVSAFGGASENMAKDVTGFVVQDIDGMAEAIGHIHKIDREACRQWIADNRSEAQMVEAYAALVRQVAAGERW